jgi:Aldo/keto reductase family
VGVAGRALKGFPREKVVISSKWGIVLNPGGPPTSNGSREFLRESVDQSLKRMGVDYLDLIILRSPDPNVPLVDRVRFMKVWSRPGLRRLKTLTAIVHIRQLYSYMAAGCVWDILCPLWKETTTFYEVDPQTLAEGEVKVSQTSVFPTSYGESKKGDESARGSCRWL